MQNGQHKNRNMRYSRAPAPYADHSKRGLSNSSRPEPKNSPSAQRNYERYLTLAQAEAQSGNAAFWRAHHEAWRRSELNQREYCEAQGIPLKAFGNWRAKFKAEPQLPERELLYRSGG